MNSITAEPRTLIDEPAYETRQGYGLTRTYQALVPQDQGPGVVMQVRVRIERDFYAFQSYAVAEVWTSNGWREVQSRAPLSEEMTALPSTSLWQDPRRQECIDALNAVADRLASDAYKTLRWTPPASSTP